LLLDKVSSKRCEVDIDGPIELTNLKVRIFVGKTSAKPYLSRTLNSFGDIQFKTNLACDYIRKLGVFVLLDNSSVRLRVIE